MGAFGALLAGIAGGAGSEYSRISEQQRAVKNKNNQLVAESLFNRIQSDPTLNYGDADNLLRSGLTTLGFDNKTIEGISQASGYLKQAHDEAARTAAGQAPATKASLPGLGLPGQSPMGGPNAQGQPPQIPGAGPQPQATPGAGQPNPAPQEDISTPSSPFGAMPQRTIGQIKFEQQLPQYAAEQSVNRDIQIESQRALASGKMQDAIDFVEKYANTPYAEDARRAAGLIPRNEGVRFIPGTISGSDIATSGLQTDSEGTPIDSNKDYRREVDSITGRIIGTYPTNKSARPEDWVYLGPDAQGNPSYGQKVIDSHGNPTGKIIQGIPPAYILPTINHSVVYKSVQMQDGTTKLVAVPETSTRARGGVTPQGNETPGTVGTGTPQPQQSPQSQPQPTSGGPFGAIPQPPTGGGGGVISIPGAGRPMPPEQKQKTEQQAEQLNNTIGIIKDLQQPDSRKVLSNLFQTGKIAMQIDPQQGFWRATINKTLPLTPDEIRVASDWQLLTEGVLQMRIPMGGAGFRGPEGFGAIESNKGILGQNPQIIQRVLNGTLREFRAQRGPLVKNSKIYGYGVNPEMSAEDVRGGNLGNVPSPSQSQTTPPRADGKVHITRNGKGGYILPADIKLGDIRD